jgi:hypothetical protein
MEWRALFVSEKCSMPKIEEILHHEADKWKQYNLK